MLGVTGLSENKRSQKEVWGEDVKKLDQLMSGRMMRPEGVCVERGRA